MNRIAMRKLTFITTVLLSLLWIQPCTAQIFEKAHYYINLNEGTGGHTHDIPDETLSFQYTDAYGKWKEVPVKIYDWRRNLVTTISIDKAFGLNTYTFNLKSVYTGWKLNEVYVCEMKDESGRKYELPFRLIEPPENLAPQVNIIVVPEEMDCKDFSLNLVRFYGDIKGGRGPYRASWFVLNDARTDFLYQPREESMTTAGKTSVITVDKNPDYYVMLQVKDACGNIKESIVHMVCEGNKKKINTIFVEQLDRPLPSGFPGN